MCCFRQFAAMSLFATSENILCDNDVLDGDTVSVKCCSGEEQDLICSDITDLGLCLHHARKFPSLLTLVCTQCTAHTAEMLFLLPVGLGCHFNLGGTSRGPTQGAPLLQ